VTLTWPLLPYVDSTTNKKKKEDLTFVVWRR